MFKNLKTWIVLFLLVSNTYADESGKSGGSDESDSSDSGSKPCGKSAENKKNEAANVITCDEPTPTTTCTCDLTDALKSLAIQFLNPCQLALFMQWEAQVEATILSKTSWTVSQRVVAFHYSFKAFGVQYPDIYAIMKTKQVKSYGLNELRVGDFENIALSFMDETCGSAINLDQNNNTALFDGLRQVASSCGASTTTSATTVTGTGSTATGSTATGSTGSTGTTGTGTTGTTGTPGTTGTGSTGTFGTGATLPAACAGYYTSSGTTATGSTATGSTGSTGTGTTGTGSTATGSTGSTGTGSTATGSTGTGSTATGSTGTGSTPSTPSGPSSPSTPAFTGSTGTGATVAPDCTGISVNIEILISKLLVILQNPNLEYSVILAQISIQFDAFFVQFPQYKQIILGGSIQGFFSIQGFYEVSFKYQQSSSISTVISGDVSTCPLLLALQKAYQKPVCASTGGSTGSTGSTATGSTGSTATGSTGSTATGSTGSTATGSTGTTGTGTTGTGTTATGSTPTGSTATGSTGSTGSTVSGGTTSSSGGDCIPLDIQEKLQAFYDVIAGEFSLTVDINVRIEKFSFFYYQFTKDLPGLKDYLDDLKCGSWGKLSDIIYISAIITFPQVDSSGIDALINITVGWNNTAFVQSFYNSYANLNKTYTFHNFGWGITQWTLFRNTYINGNISLIISDTATTYRQKHIKICGVMQKFISIYNLKDFFYCTQLGSFGTVADYFQALRISPSPKCPIPRGCMKPRNDLIAPKPDGSTDFTNGWNNMVNSLSASDKACVQSYSASINSIVFGSVPSGGPIVQISQIVVQINAAKSSCPTAAPQIDGCLVGKWGHLKKFCDCQTTDGNTSNYPSK